MMSHPEPSVNVPPLGRAVTLTMVGLMPMLLRWNAVQGCYVGQYHRSAVDRVAIVRVCVPASPTQEICRP